MGRLVIQNAGISIEVLLALLAELELELRASNDDPVLKRAVVMTGGAFVMLYAAALQGGKILLTEASELVCRILEVKSHPQHLHVLLTLMGRFKGETGEHSTTLSSVW